MKSINFINPVPPHKQRAFAWWFYTSCALLAVTLVVLGYIQLSTRRASQTLAYEIIELQKSVDSLDTLVSQKQTLVAQKKMLEDRLQHICHLQNNAQDSHTLLRTLASVIPPTVRLTQLSGKLQETIAIEGLAHDTRAVTTFLESLNACSCVSDMKLSHISACEGKEQGHELLQFRLEGKWLAEQ